MIVGKFSVNDGTQNNDGFVRRLSLSVEDSLCNFSRISTNSAISNIKVD